MYPSAVSRVRALGREMLTGFWRCLAGPGIHTSTAGLGVGPEGGSVVAKAAYDSATSTSLASWSCFSSIQSDPARKEGRERTECLMN